MSNPFFPCQAAFCRSSIYARMSFIRSVIFKWFNPLTGREDREIDAQDADAQPSSDSSSFQLAGTSKEDIYRRLVAVAQGDAHQILPAMDAISRSHSVDDSLLFDIIKKCVGNERPYEAGHFFRRLFDRASLRTRIGVIGEFVSSPLMGDKQMVGELFLSLLEHSTMDERKNEIYPGLLSIINGTPSSFSEVTSKRAFLAALLRGWMSEI